MSHDHPQDLILWMNSLSSAEHFLIKAEQFFKPMLNKFNYEFLKQIIPLKLVCFPQTFTQRYQYIHSTCLQSFQGPMLKAGVLKSWEHLPLWWDSHYLQAVPWNSFVWQGEAIAGTWSAGRMFHCPAHLQCNRQKEEVMDCGESQ